MANRPIVAGWTTSSTNNGFIGPESFASADIICHKNSSNAKGYAVVAAGDNISLQWNTWPESHRGPVIDYLPDCGSTDCEAVDKNSLQFFKIGEIPTSIAPRFYVLRHEIIALHEGGQYNGAQNYPQCFNLKVTGGGSLSPAGTEGTSLYTPCDAGILFNIYTPLASYPIPGPTLIAGATSIIKASATAITGFAEHRCYSSNHDHPHYARRQHRVRSPCDRQCHRWDHRHHNKSRHPRYST